MLLRAWSIIAAAIVNASGHRGDGLEGHFEERGTIIRCIDTNNPSIEAPFRAYDRLPKCPGIRPYAGFNAGRQMVIGHRKGTSLQRLGCTNIIGPGAHACATCQQHNEE